MSVLKVSELKKIGKDCDKRVSKEAIALFDIKVEKLWISICKEHNGGRKTVDAGVVEYLSPSK